MASSILCDCCFAIVYLYNQEKLRRAIILRYAFLDMGLLPSDFVDYRKLDYISEGSLDKHVWVLLNLSIC